MEDWVEMMMGFPPTDKRNPIETAAGVESPVDLNFVRLEAPDGTLVGNTPWLMKQFGLV